MKKRRSIGHIGRIRPTPYLLPRVSASEALRPRGQPEIAAAPGCSRAPRRYGPGPHLSLFLLLLLALALALGGCVGYTPPVPPATDPPAPSTPRPTRQAATLRPSASPIPLPSPAATLGIGADAVQGMKVRFWAAAPAGAAALLHTLAEEFNQANPWGITVETALFEDTSRLVEEVQASIYGDLPDVVSLYTYQAGQLSAGGGLLIDLSPYAADPQWGFTADEARDFFPLFWDQDVGDGRRLGVPFYRLGQALYYNQTWAGELGFDRPPTTPQEFQAQVCAAAGGGQAPARAGEGAGGWLVDVESATLAGWLEAFGSQYVLPDGQGYRFDNAQSRQALAFLRELASKGCAWVGEDRYPVAEFAGRSALVVAGSTAAIPAQQAAFAQEGRADRWTVLPFPAVGGEPGMPIYGPSLSILKSTPEKQMAAWLFLKWLVSAENQARLVEASGALPTRASVADLLGAYRERYPQWSAALDLLPYARLEPGHPSWKTVRLALSDAGRQLFSPSFQAGRIPELLAMLDETAAEIYRQSR